MGDHDRNYTDLHKNKENKILKKASEFYGLLLLLGLYLTHKFGIITGYKHEVCCAGLVGFFFLSIIRY